PAEVHQLGAPLGVRRARKGGLAPRLFFGAVIFALTVTPALIGLVGCLLALTQGKPGDAGMFLAFGAGFSLVAYLSGRYTRRAWRNWGVSVALAPLGLAYVRGRKTVAYRWQDIEQFRCRSTDHLMSGVYLHTV